MKEKYKEVFNEGQIRRRVRELGAQISRDFAGKEIVVIGVLKGAFVFMADLIRELNIPLRCDFIRISSYAADGRRDGPTRLDFDITQPIENEDVLLIEDILDTGHSLRYLLQHLSAKSPRSLSVCCLLDKKHHPDLSKQLRYVGFEAPDAYLIGYGLDLDGKYRELSGVAEVELPD